MNKNLRPYAALVIFIFAVLLFFISATHKGNKYPYRANSFYGTTESRSKTLEEQIKFNVKTKEVLEIISNSRTMLNYRVKSLGKYCYQDYYYDTPEYDIAKSECSYRFRTVSTENDEVEYRIQFKKEYAKEKDDFTRTEVDINIPEDLGRRMLSGDFSYIFSEGLNNEEIDKLNKYLLSQKINIKTLSPQIYGKQYRDRYSLKENRITFFEISLDEAQFVHLKDKHKQISFMEMEFESKYKNVYTDGQTRFIEERIKELIKFFNEKYKMQISRDSKYKKVVMVFNLVNHELKNSLDNE